MDTIIYEVASELDFWSMVFGTFFKCLLMKKFDLGFAFSLVKKLLDNKRLVKDIIIEVGKELAVGCISGVNELREEVKKRTVERVFLQ